MENEIEIAVTRPKILVRFALTIVFLIVIELLVTIIQLTVLFQFVYLLITRKYHQPIRRFANKVSSYLYRVSRYSCLNENQLPFPFSDFPDEVEPAEESVTF